MFTLSDSKQILFFNGSIVQHNGEILEGNYIALIFSPEYCFIQRPNESIDKAIDDYIDCTGLCDLDVKVKSITL